MADLTIFNNYSPRIVEVDLPDTQISIQELYNKIRIWEDDDTHEDDDSLIDAAGKENLGGGVTVGITAELKNSQVAFKARTTSISSGTCTTANAAGTILIDSAATFVTDGVQIGAIVVNFTDQSVASVLSIESETQLTMEILDDGTDNDWDVNDAYKIWNWTLCEVDGGNLVAIDDNDVQISALQPRFGVSYVRTSSSSATLQELDAIQFSSFNGGVTVDVVSGNSGIDFPIGTPRKPCNNFIDALTIANQRGLVKFFVIGNCTLGSGLDFDEFTFEGQSITRTTITIEPSASVIASEFTNCKVTGTLDGNSTIEKGIADSLNVVDGTIRNSGLIGEIILSGVDNLQLIDCYEGSQIRPYINFAGSGTGLVVTNYNGAIGLKNKSGAENAFLDMASGDILIDNDVTNGEITLRGVAKWDNKFTYSGGATIIDETIFTRVDETHGQIIRAVFLDGTAATNGNGYQQSPFNNWADTIVAVSNRLLRNVVLEGNVSMDRDISGLTIKGLSLPQVILTGFKIDSCNFEECVITGTQGTATDVNTIQFFQTCGILNVNNFNGSSDGSALAGVIQIADGATCIFNKATELNPKLGAIVIDFKLLGTAGSTVALEEATGDYIIRNMDHPDDLLQGNFLAAKITVEASCVDGSINLSGIGDWENSNTYVGTTVVENHLVSPQETQYSAYNGAVWLDSLATTTGQTYPYGTTQFPVNNGTDAEAVANDNGFLEINIVHPTTLTSTHTEKKFIGRSPRTTPLTVDASANLTGVEFETMLLTGDLGSNGSSYYTTVAMKNLSGIFGHAENCIFREGTITIAAGGLLMANKCAGVSAGNPGTDIPIIDCNGTGRLAMRNFTGEVVIQNKTGGNDCSLALNGASVTLDSTITAGNWRVFGVGVLIDNSGGTATVDTSELLAPEYLLNAVYVDTDAITNGNGEPSSPFNNIGDTLNYAESKNLKVIYTYAEIILDRNLKNFQVIGIGNPVVDLNGYDIKGTEIDKCTLRGNYIDSLVAKDCILDNNFYLKGLFTNCGLNGDLICNDGDVTLQQPYSTIAGSARPTISLVGAGATNLSVRNYSGGLTIKDMNNALDNATIEMSQGKLTLDSTCVAGNISCRGVSQFTDNSAGTNVDLTGLWDTETSNYYLVNILKMVYNNVTVTNDIATVYEEDGITIWKQFDLSNNGRILQ